MKKVIFLASPGQTNSAFFNRFIAICKSTKLAGYMVEIVNIKPFKSPRGNSGIFGNWKGRDP